MDKKPIILIVEDEEHIRTALNYTFETNGFEVCLAVNGVEALKFAKYKKPDLILLDFVMPEMNGIEALEELKKYPSLKDVPVYMLTAMQSEVDIKRAFALGAEGYLKKPFDPDKLVQKLKSKIYMHAKD
ncbi:MAG: response regulator [Planctomycetes bacterium]|nr:response regulator [Planctomycetota bacterium]